MATNVTVTESYIHPDFFGQQNLPYYSFTNVIGGGGGGTSNMAWLGNTADAVGTYGGENTIIAESSLLYSDVSGSKYLQPASNYGASLGRSGYRFTDLWVGSIYAEASLVTGVTYIGDLNTGLQLSSAGDLTFQDDVYGSSITLSELAADKTSFGNYTEIPITNVGGTDFDYASAFKLDSGILYAAQGISMDAPVTADISMKVATAEKLSIEVTATTATITNRGDYFYIKNSETNFLYMDVTTIQTYRDIIPTDTQDLGSSSAYFEEGYFNTLYIGDTGISITSDSAGNMIFADNSISAGTVTLGELIGGGSPGSSYTFDNGLVEDSDGTVGLASEITVETINFFDSTTYITMSSAGDLVFADSSSGSPHTLSDLINAGMVYPGAGIPISTGSAWGTSITDNHTNWDTAYTHSQLTTGNPHDIGYADITDFSTGVSTYETSHSDVLVDSDFTHSTSGFMYTDGAGGYSVDDTVYLTTNESITLSGDVTGSGTTAITTTIAADAVEYGMLNDNVISGQTELTSGLASADELLVSDAGVIKRMDISVIEAYIQANLSYADITDFNTGVSAYETSHSDVLVDSDFTHSTAGFMYTDGAGGYSVDDSVYLTAGDRYWTRSGTSLYPATAGDDIKLPNSSYRILFGDEDTFIFESSDDLLILTASGTNLALSSSATIFYKDATPSGNHTIDLGSAPYNYWRNLYVDQAYFEGPGQYIAVDSGNNLIFCDGYAGEVKLSDFETTPIFERSGSEITFVNANDYLQFATGGNEGIFFGGIDTGLVEPSSNLLRFMVNSGIIFDLSFTELTTYRDFIADTTSTRDLGSSSIFFAESYVNTMFIEDSNTYITRDGSNELSFTDAVSGTIALSDLGLSDGDKGDITVSGGGGTWTIDTAAVTFAKMQDISADRLLGRITGGTGDIEQLTGTQATTLLDTFSTSSTTKGLVPGANGVGSSYYLCADGTWDIPPGSGGSGGGGGAYSGLGIHSTISSQTCTGGTTTNITIGDAATDVKLIIDYTAERSGEKRTGQFFVMFDDNTDTVRYGYGQSLGPSLGMTLTADATSAGDIRLQVIVDDTDSTDLDFEAYITYSGSNTYDVEFHVDGSLMGYWTSGAMVPATTDVTDLGSSSLYWDNLYVKKIFLDDGNTYIELDGSGNMQFTDTNTGTVDLIDLVGGSGATGGGYWDKNGTDLSPATAGDDILLATSGVERILWGDGDTGFYESSDDVLDVIVGASSNWQMTTSVNRSYRDIVPSTSKTLDFGSSSLFWDNAYVDRLYIDNTNTYIDVSGTDMIFYSADYPAGKTIADLLAGGGGGDVVASGTLTDNYVMVGNGGTSITVADATINFASQSITNVDNISVNTYMDIKSLGNKTSDLGGSGQFFDNAYVDRLYIDNTNTYIDVSGSEMTFTDATSGTVPLSDLTGAVSSPFEENSANEVVFVTPGRDLLFRDSGERLMFGDDTTYFAVETWGIDIMIKGAGIMNLVNTGVQTSDLRPITDTDYDLGTDSIRWGTGFFDTVNTDALAGGLTVPVAIKTSNYNATTSDFAIGQAGTYSVTFPASPGTGKMYIVWNTSSGTPVTVSNAGGDTFYYDGGSGSTYQLDGYESAWFVFDGSNWRVITKYA